MYSKEQITEMINSARIPSGTKRILADMLGEIDGGEVVEVDGCDVCPMRYMDKDGNEGCNHPNTIFKDEVYWVNRHLFKQCPLKQKSITVSLKTK